MNWTLDSKHIHQKMDCPWCGGRKRFTPVIDENKNIIEGYGICDRIHSCPTKQKFPNGEKWERPTRLLPPPPRRQSHYFTGIGNQFDRPNVFTRWLIDTFGFEAYIEINDRFQIITVIHQGYDWVTWLQTNDRGQVHTGKMMRYELVDGQPKRMKKGYTQDWIHKVWLTKEQQKQFTYTQSLFGSTALRRHPDKAVCIVESEKTAVIATIFHPEHIWLSVGGASNLVAYNNSCSIMAPVKNRRVILFPDDKQREDWTKHCKTLQLNGFNVKMAEDLTALGWQVGDDADLADYLLQSPEMDKLRWKKK